MAMTEIPPIPLPSASSTIPDEPEVPVQTESAPPEPEAPTPSSTDPSEPQPADAQAPVPPAPAAEPAPDPVALELEEIRLKMEETELEQRTLRQQLEHERLLREEAASKAGYYKRVAVDLAAPRRQPVEPAPVDEYADPTEAPRVHPDTLRFQQELDALRTDAIERAQMEAVSQFFAANPDAQAKQKELEPFVVQARARYAEWLESNDPKLIRRAAAMTLDTAWLNAQKAAVAARRTERLATRASTLQRLAEEKRAASIPGSGAAAAPAPRQPNQPMSEAEAERILDDPRTWGG